MTQTLTKRVACGRCTREAGEVAYHGSAQEVRECYGVPDATATRPVARTGGASPAQIKFIQDLAAQLGSADVADQIDYTQLTGGMEGTASAMITQLKQTLAERKAAGIKPAAVDRSVGQEGKGKADRERAALTAEGLIPMVDAFGSMEVATDAVRSRMERFPDAAERVSYIIGPRASGRGRQTWVDPIQFREEPLFGVVSVAHCLRIGVDEALVAMESGLRVRPATSMEHRLVSLNDMEEYMKTLTRPDPKPAAKRPAAKRPAAKRSVAKRAPKRTPKVAKLKDAAVEDAVGKAVAEEPTGDPIVEFVDADTLVIRHPDDRISVWRPA